MKRLACLVLCLSWCVPALAGEAKIRRAKNRIPNHYLVTLSRSFQPQQVRAVAAEAAAKNGAKVHHVFEAVVPGFWAEMSEQQATALLRHPAVESIEEDGLMTPALQYPAPVHLDRVDQRYLPLDSWYRDTCATGGTGVTYPVAYVMDGGIRADHREFYTTTSNPASRVIGGVDFTLQGFNPGVGYSTNPCAGQTVSEQCSGYCTNGGHGTAVASVLAGLTYGAAKDARLVSVRVMNCNGTGISKTRVARGLEWIYYDYPTRNAPAVLNMSFGGPADEGCDPDVGYGTYCTSHVENWISALIHQRNITVVAAAHNMNADAENYAPARLGNDHEGFITVGASGIFNINGQLKDARWMCLESNPGDDFCAGNPGSNYGTAVDIWAVGQNVASAGIRAFDPSTGTYVNSTTAERQEARSGTSFAAPIVAGVAARIMYNTAPGTWTPGMVWNQISTDATSGNMASPPDGTVDGAGSLHHSPNRFLFRQGPTRCRAY